MDGLHILGILCIIIFFLYLIKVVKSGPYIVNFRNGDATRIQKIIITSANLISNKGKSIMSKFVPNIVQINMRDTVTFINKDKLRHSVEIINPNLHNSKILEINDKFSKYLKLSLKKFFTYYFIDINSTYPNYYNFFHVVPIALLSLLSFPGLLIFYKTREFKNKCLLMYLFLNLIIFSAFFILPRYKLIILPIQIILASYFILHMLKKFVKN